MKTDGHQLLAHALETWRTMRLLGYIDPGTGSYGYQLLIAGVTGVLFFFASIKRKIMSLFTKAGPPPDLADTPPPKEPLARESKDETTALRS